MHMSLGVSGLINLGNTCFFNSIVQILLHTDPFVNHLLQSKPFIEARINRIVQTGNMTEEPQSQPSTDGSAASSAAMEETIKRNKIALLVTSNMTMVCERYWTSDSTICPRDLMQSMIIADRMYQEMQQQDAHEVLLFLWNLFHTALAYTNIREYGQRVITRNQYLIKDSFDQYSRHFSNKWSIITDLFYGQTLSRVHCTHCGHTNLNFQVANHYQLNLPDVPGMSCSLKCLLNNYCGTDILDDENKYECEQCKYKINAVKQMRFWRLPNILVLHLARFKLTGTNGAAPQYVKNTNLVHFPDQLDMSPYSDYERKSYRLYGIVNHTGNLNGGHYYSYILNAGHWCVYNDCSVHAISPNSIVTNNAYLLFYYVV